jgi:flavin reductase (DIM6/NTAB) family NADH-FMN oxidoreductase RutF
MTTPLPVALRQWLRPLAQWPPVALHQPQEAVLVRLSSVGREFDVTAAAVIVSLRPLTLAVGLDAQLATAIQEHPQPQLRFIDLESGRTVGLLELQHVRTWQTAQIAIGMFAVRRGSHRCLRWPHRPWNRWLQNRRMRQNRDPNNFSMPPDAVQQQMIFYICPRPVVLVSVDDGNHSNLFPMDLIGPVTPDRFTLALRTTSPSIPTMKSARCLALSDVSAGEFATAYKLGIHHKHARIQWDELPFAIRRSKNYALPYPASALRVRELEILDSDTVGSHVLFVTRVASEQRHADDPQFFHTSGIYQHFRSLQARAFPGCG